ncbi:hypothetical protein JAAARDRAFT_29603 [Jaapia argillacea MUCL 33604]|uniref:Uncharacterized protein n=1 Tax=Jaapia argillacea MUCL 33604 TaxID=933084 RepID=A0A067QJ87_9AGAM|nr:hypothetical protein JAAARDRAFT_29603 [Jaapia argillacea MUCL 33604]
MARSTPSLYPPTLPSDDVDPFYEEEMQPSRRAPTPPPTTRMKSPSGWPYATVSPRPLQLKPKPAQEYRPPSPPASTSSHAHTPPSEESDTSTKSPLFINRNVDPAGRGAPIRPQRSARRALDRQKSVS